jgi:hypothetical protein
VLLPFEVSAIAPTLLALCAALGVWLGHAATKRHIVLPSLFVLIALGLWVGLAAPELPFGRSIVVGALLIAGMRLALNRPDLNRWDRFLIPVLIVLQAWFAADMIVDQLSFPAPIAVGTSTLAAFMFCLAYWLTGAQKGEDTAPSWLSAVGVVVVLAALGWRFMEYTALYEEQYASEWSLGIIRLPLLAVVLLLGALFTWPRRRKVLEQVGVEWKQPVTHWVLLIAAVLLFPFGAITFHNPWFEPDAPKANAAKRVLAHVLSNAYHAFNIKDEQALYDRIAETVSGDLVAEMYLKSRQHLMSGTLKGATITIKDVSVLAVGDVVQGVSSENGFTYECKWQVVARVQHMAHVHHRRNVYNGALTIGFEEDAWKLIGVELKSEERVVVPWQDT